MEINTKNYVCVICGKRHVKLWRAYDDCSILICAHCAEGLQSRMWYDERIWERDKRGVYQIKFTGKKLPLPKWQVDEKGKVPSYSGPVPKGVISTKTNILIVDFTWLSKRHNEKTPMVPACIDEEGKFYVFTPPSKIYKLWEELPNDVLQ